jgi:hypothetical protein
VAIEYLIADVLSGEVRDSVPFSTLGYSEVLCRPGGWDATIGIRHPKARRSILDPGAVALWVADGSNVLFGGPLWPLGATIDEDGGEFVTVGGQGFLSLYRDGRRTVRSRLGMSNATGTLSSDVVWPAGTDRFLVVEDLFAHAAAIGGAADLNLEVVRRGPLGAGLSGSLLDGELAITTTERRGIGELLEELADADDGIDFGFAYRWEGNNLLKPSLELYYPARGRRTGIVFEAGKNITILDWQLDAGPMANLIEGFGAGEGETMVRATSQDASLLAPTGAYPLLEGAVSIKNATAAAELRAATDGELARRRLPRQTLSVELIDTDDVPLGSFIAGDFIEVAATEGIYELDGTWRVVSLAPSFDDTGAVTVKVDLAQGESYEALL